MGTLLKVPALQQQPWTQLQAMVCETEERQISVDRDDREREKTRNTRRALRSQSILTLSSDASRRGGTLTRHTHLYAELRICPEVG